MKLIDGKVISAQIRKELGERTKNFFERYGKRVGLAVVLIGEDPASKVYVRNKISGCEEVGIRSFAHFLPANTTQEQAVELIRALAEDKNVHGILVQLPLPRHLDAQKILREIPTEKMSTVFLLKT